MEMNLYHYMLFISFIMFGFVSIFLSIAVLYNDWRVFSIIFALSRIVPIIYVKFLVYVKTPDFDMFDMPRVVKIISRSQRNRISSGIVLNIIDKPEDTKNEDTKNEDTKSKSTKSNKELVDEYIKKRMYLTFVNIKYTLSDESLEQIKSIKTKQENEISALEWQSSKTGNVTTEIRGINTSSLVYTDYWFHVALLLNLDFLYLLLLFRRRENIDLNLILDVKE